jgi:hypothetical protein
MPLISEAYLQNFPGIRDRTTNEIDRALKNAPFKKNPRGRYDVFLSHRSSDARLIFAVKLLLELHGFAVFVDWVEAPRFDRTKVTPETAGLLRMAMKQSDSLVFAASHDSPNSKWMPWELGYSDGLHGRVAVLPIVEFPTSSEAYQGQEYLGLYPYVTLNEVTGPERIKLFVNLTPDHYLSLDTWIRS